MIQLAEVTLAGFIEWLKADSEREITERASESVVLALAKAQVSFPEVTPNSLSLMFPPGQKKIAWTPGERLRCLL